MDDFFDMLDYLLDHYTQRKLATILGLRNSSYLSHLKSGLRNPSAAIYQKVKTNFQIVLQNDLALEEQAIARVNPTYYPVHDEDEDDEYIEDDTTDTDRMNIYYSLKQQANRLIQPTYNDTSWAIPSPPPPVTLPADSRCQQCHDVSRKLQLYKFPDAHIAALCPACITKYQQAHTPPPPPTVEQESTVMRLFGPLEQRLRNKSRLR